MQKQRRLKVIAASVVLLCGMALLVMVGIKRTSVRHFTPAALEAGGSKMNNQQVQVDGLIAEGSSEWDAAQF